MFSLIELSIGMVLVFILLTISLPMDVEYHNAVKRAAYNPAARLAACAAVVGLALYSPFLAFLGLLVVFFWMSDIQLLTKRRVE